MAHRESRSRCPALRAVEAGEPHRLVLQRHEARREGLRAAGENTSGVVCPAYFRTYRTLLGGELELRRVALSSCACDFATILIQDGEWKAESSDERRRATALLRA